MANRPHTQRRWTLQQIAGASGHVVKPKTMVSMIARGSPHLQGASKQGHTWTLPEGRATSLVAHLNAAKEAIAAGKVHDFNEYQRLQMRGTHQMSTRKGWVGREQVITIPGALKPSAYIARAYKYHKAIEEYPSWARKEGRKWYFKPDYITADVKAAQDAKAKESPYLKSTEGAKLLGCTRRTFLNYADRGLIPFTQGKSTKKGVVRLIPRSDFMKMLPELKRMFALSVAKAQAGRPRKGGSQATPKPPNFLSMQDKRFIRSLGKTRAAGPKAYPGFATNVMNSDMPAPEKLLVVQSVNDALQSELEAAMRGQKYKDHPLRQPMQILSDKTAVQGVVDALNTPTKPKTANGKT